MDTTVCCFEHCLPVCLSSKCGLLFQNMANMVLEKVVKKLKLVKFVVTSRYWRLWRPFNEPFRQSQALLRQSMPLTGRYIKR